MAAVKVGVSRQVAIPKDLHDRLGLKPGDYLEVELEGSRLVFTPKQLVEKRLAEALDDVKHGRVGGPYRSVEDFIASLHGRKGKTKKAKKTS